MTSAVERVKEKFEQDLKKAELEDKIASHFVRGEHDTDGFKRWIHVHTLYGSHATVKYEMTVPGGRHPTFADVLALVGAFPAVSIRFVRDSCASFRPTSYVEALPEEKKARWDAEYEVAAIIFRIHGNTYGHGPRMLDVEWYTDVPGVGLVEINVRVPHEHWRRLATFEPKYGFNGRGNRTKLRESTGLSLNPELHSIYHVKDGEVTGEPVAQVESPIRWWADGTDDNDFTLYFVHLGDIAPEVGAYDIAAQCMRLAEGAPR